MIDRIRERFWVKAVVDLRPNDSAAVTSILEKCLREKISLYSSNNFPREQNALSVEQAMAQFLEGLHPVNPYYSIGFIYENAPFLLEFYPHESEPSIWVQLSALEDIRYKKGETGIMRIDLAYYAKLLLLLCKELPLLEFRTVVDGENNTESA